MVFANCGSDFGPKGKAEALREKEGERDYGEKN
jgi:hypothetical protein